MRPAGGREGYKVGQSRPTRPPAFAAPTTGRATLPAATGRLKEFAGLARVAARFVGVRKSGSSPLEKYKAAT